jgi:acetyl-CoA acetyltransferase
MRDESTVTHSLKNATAVVGVGSSAFTIKSERSNLRLAAEALRNALDDSGLRKNDIDGFITNIGRPTGMDYDEIAEGLGLRASYTVQTWNHGRFGAPALQIAAMAVACGLATTVACICVAGFAKARLVGGPGNDQELRETGGPHGEYPAHGQAAPVSGAAYVLRYYQERFGVTPEKLATVPLTFRKHAALNPNAVMRDRTLTMDDYLNAPFIIEPMRRYDCAVPSDGSVVMLVTSAERAADSRQRPVYLRGMQGLPSGRRESRYGTLPGSGVNQDSVFSFEPNPAETLAYRMADVTPEDINGLYIYDHFSPGVLVALERFGFCKVGEAADWIHGGRIALGGALPINTNGGHLSEAHVSGWNHMAEIVRQLRGECGERQIKDAEVLQYVDRAGTSVIFGR